MTVTVTKMPGGIVELFNPDTGRITYKAKGETAYLLLENMKGIVRFPKKGSLITIQGPNMSLNDCEMINADSPDFKNALLVCLQAEKKFLEEKRNDIDSKIQEINSKISSI